MGEVGARQGGAKSVSWIGSHLSRRRENAPVNAYRFSLVEFRLCVALRDALCVAARDDAGEQVADRLEFHRRLAEPRLVDGARGSRCARASKQGCHCCCCVCGREWGDEAAANTFSSRQRDLAKLGRRSPLSLSHHTALYNSCATIACFSDHSACKGASAHLASLATAPPARPAGPAQALRKSMLTWTPPMRH